VRVAEVELQSVVDLLSFFIFLPDEVRVKIVVVVDDGPGNLLTALNVVLNVIFYSERAGLSGSFCRLFELSKILFLFLFLFLLLCLMLLKLLFFFAFQVLNAVVLPFFFPHPLMQPFQEVFAFERVVDSIVASFWGLLVSVEEKIAAFGLPSVDDIFLKLFFVHVDFLLSDVEVVVLVLVVLKNLL